MSPRLQDYIDRHQVRYDVCSHPLSHSSSETARAAHVPAHCLAKSVMLEDERGCVMAVLPADARVELDALGRTLGRTLRLMPEARLNVLFDDCEPGAVPPVGMAWGIETVVDERLDRQPEIWLEGGDHRQLLHLQREQFLALMHAAQHAAFGSPPLH